MDQIPEVEPQVRKINRRRVQEADATRPVVHGAVQYLGHRPDAKHERRRQAALIRKARKRS